MEVILVDVSEHLWKTVRPFTFGEEDDDGKSSTKRWAEADCLCAASATLHRL